MALRYFDGFDYYDYTDLNARYNISGTSWRITPGAGRFSSGALVNLVSGGGESLTKFLDDQGTLIVGVAIKFDHTGTASSLIEIANHVGPQVELRLNSSAKLIITSNGTTLATGTTTLLPNTFYFIEFKVTFSASCAANSCVAQVGGVTEVTVPATSNTAPNGTFGNRVSLRYDWFVAIFTYDDFYICDGTGSLNNDFLGDVRVEVLLPNADGHYTDFTVHGGGSAFSAIDETAEDGDTSYIFTNTVGDISTFLFPNLSTTPQTIFGMQLINVARKDDAGSRALAGMIRFNFVDYVGDDQGVTDTYTYQTSLWETNPATSALWIGGDINLLEAGCKLTR